MVDITKDSIQVRPQDDVRDQYSSIIDKLKYLSPRYHILNAAGKNIEARKKIKELDPDREIGFFENLPFYDGIGDFNFSPKITEENDFFTADGKRKITQSQLDRKDYRPNTMNPNQIEKFQKDYNARQAELDKAEKTIADAKAKAEAKAAYDDSAKGRFEKFYNDDGKRNAVLNAISDTMLQTKYGKDVYGNRMNELPGNINRALAQNEALDMAKTQAALDMQQTAAETSKLNNPLEWLSDKQKQARDIATAMGAEQGYEFGSPEWKEAYARELRQIAAPSLMSGSIDGIVGIKDLLIKYGSTLDQETMDVMNGLVDVLQAQLPGNAGAPSQSYNTIKAKVKE
jgi:hypothetical protein|tara:strand:+ start:751 stop:1779 length:1029 start_codon:yes stop_codon:yes gene_type:complete